MNGRTENLQLLKYVIKDTRNDIKLKNSTTDINLSLIYNIK